MASCESLRLNVRTWCLVSSTRLGTCFGLGVKSWSSTEDPVTKRGMNHGDWKLINRSICRYIQNLMNLMVLLDGGGKFSRLALVEEVDPRACPWAVSFPGLGFLPMCVLAAKYFLSSLCLLHYFTSTIVGLIVHILTTRTLWAKINSF